jgi:hypothetical protein
MEIVHNKGQIETKSLGPLSRTLDIVDAPVLAQQRLNGSLGDRGDSESMKWRGRLLSRDGF